MKRTLGDVICQNTDTIQALPLNAFRTLLDNDLVSCDDPARSQLDFEAIAKAITGKSDTNNATTNTNDENDNMSENYGHETSSDATGQVFSKRIEITPQIYIRKLEEQKA